MLVHVVNEQIDDNIRELTIDLFPIFDLPGLLDD